MTDPYRAPEAALQDPPPAMPAAAKTIPSSYWTFWQRGWWALLYTILTSALMSLLLVPVAFMLAGRPNFSLMVLALVLIFVWLPAIGWLFEVFASGSKRIVTYRKRALPAKGTG